MVKYKFLIVEGSDSYRVSIPEDAIELWSFNTRHGPGKSYALCTWYDGALRCRFVSHDDVDRLSSKFGSVKHIGSTSHTKTGKKARKRLQRKQHK